MRSLEGIVWLSLVVVALSLLAGILLTLLRILGTLRLALGRFAPARALKRIKGFLGRSDPPPH